MWRRLLVVLAVLAVLVGAPVLALDLVAERAERCFASVEQPRAAALPQCESGLGVLSSLSRLPLLGRHAALMREEIVARSAAAAYIDAAVGSPNRQQLAQRFKPLRDIARDVESTSGRLRFDELGPPVDNPYPGNTAYAVGDHRSLDEFAFHLTQHFNERRAMEDALLHADLKRAVRLARHYAGRPNPDLRVEVAALLCLGGMTERGIEQVVGVEQGRAADRSANFSRHFGAVRLVIEVCAHLGKVDAPGVPAYGGAGEWDHRERIMAMRLRLLRQAHPGCDWTDPEGCRKDGVVESNISHAHELLGSGQKRRHRLHLVAMATDSFTDAAQAVRLSTPLAGETPPRFGLLADIWVSHIDDEPFVVAQRWEASANKLASFDAPQLDGVIRSMWAQAAMARALRGELRAADTNLARYGGASALLQSIAALVSGDRDEAGRRLGRAEGPYADLLRAQLAMPDKAAARQAITRVLADATIEGTELHERAQWMALAIGQPFDAPALPRIEVMGSSRIPISPAARAHKLANLLGTWSHWLASDGEARRAHRYTLFHHRGDAPVALSPYVYAVGNLLDDADGDVETWLDAALAHDRRRFSLRRFAFSRWRAASWRGDDAAVTKWHGRFTELSRLSRDPKQAELLQAMRL